MTRPATALVLALAVLAPVGVAGWTLQGSTEPDTPQDRASPYGFQDPDTSPSAEGVRIYFNALLHHHTPNRVGHHADVNPNLLPGGRVAPLSTTAKAFLGAWKDCNGDGYVGEARTGLFEYPEVLLEDEAACPAGSDFRKEGNVVEFLWVGPRTGAGEVRHVVDEEAAVWGDFGRPGDPPFFVCTRGDDLGAHGALASTGRTVHYVDCHNSFVVGPFLSSTAPGLAFDDPYHPEKDCGHPLNQPVSPYGDAGTCHENAPAPLEEGGEPAFTTWDCEADEPDIALGDPGASWYEGINNTERGAPSGTGCDPMDNFGSLGSPTGLLRVPRYHLTADEYPAHDPRQPRRGSDFPLAFLSPSYYHEPPPYDPAIRMVSINEGWYGSVVDYYAPPEHRGQTVRSDLETQGPVWTTFYARLGVEIVARYKTPAATPGVYGAEACGDHTQGEWNGWDCDRSHWYWWPEDNWPMPEPLPGDAYHLRDVDCHDGTLTTALDPHGLPRPKASLQDVSTDAACP